ncbi:MAG: amidophosphoribosyltransferase [Bacteroidia bacterium]|nr:MAG: amidophosphoribosyltransferase [Bacteroidia bacterium]
MYGIPKTNFHLNPNNKVFQLFWEESKIEFASSFYYFEKATKYQRLIHYLKYEGEKELALMLGKLFAADLQKCACFKNIDFIVPIPLHPTRERKRGYNQSFWFAKGLAEIMNKPIDTKSVCRKKNTTTQTQKNKEDRQKNMKDAFFIQNESAINNKHILLVDDVITTGSTLKECAKTILEKKGTKVSIATLAYAGN